MIRRVLILAVALGLTATSASASETVVYVYDVHGRLIGVERSGTVNDGVDTAYAYDDGDSRTSKVTTGASPLLAADDQPEAESEDFDDANDAWEAAAQM